MLKNVFFLGLFTMFFVQSYVVHTNFLIAILLLIILVATNYDNKNFIKESFDSYGIMMLIWFVWGSVSLMWVRSFDGWKNHVLILFIMLIYTIAINNLSRDKKFRTQMEYVLLIIIIVNIVIGLFEVNTGIYLFTSNKESIQWYRFIKYPVSFFFNTNDYASFLTFSLIFILTNTKSNMNKTSSIFFKLFKFFLLGSIIILLVYTQARLNLIASLISLILYYFFTMKNVKTKYLFAVTSLFVIGVIAFKFENIIQMLGGLVENDESSSVRLNLIKNGLSFLEKSNYIGIGAGNAKYYLSYFSEYNTLGINDMHNWWIEILTSYGLVFFVYYTIIYSRFIIKGIKFRKEENMLFSLLWIIAFIPTSVVSSSAFLYLWIWVINAWAYSLLSD